MGLTETELNIIKIFAELKEASLGQIADKMMITSGYAGYLCKYLVKGGYLTVTDHSTYCLTAKGKEVLTGRTAGIPWDQKTIQAIAQELAKQLGGVVTTLPQKVRGRSKAVLAREPKRKEIKIKESFIDPLDEEIKMKQSFSQKPKECRTSGTDIEKTLKALKKIPK